MVGSYPLYNLRGIAHYAPIVSVWIRNMLRHHLSAAYGRKLLIWKSCRVYIAFPHISQRGVNASTLEVQRLVLTDPTPTSFHLEQVSILRSNSSYHPDLDAFNASLSLNGTGSPYAYINIPATHATTIAYSTVNQTVQIVDLDRFADYTAALISSEEIAVAVQGRTGLHEMRFPTTMVNFDKVTILKGRRAPFFILPSFLTHTHTDSRLN